MAITVKGVEVRPEEVNVETEFLFLTEEGQKRVFLENKEKFLLDALNSEYSTVRRLLWKPEVLETCSPAFLNDAIKVCLISKALPADDTMVLINAVGSELGEYNREIIACATRTYVKDSMKLKALIAQDEKTSLELLKQKEMFSFAAVELIQVGNSSLFDAIVLNPNFKWDEELEQDIQNISPEGRVIIRERIAELRK